MNRLTISTDSTFPGILKADTFVDKTLLIQGVFQTQSEPALIVNEKSKVMITAPRRFGKSINLDIFYHFLELEVDKRIGMKITKVEHENQSVNDAPNYKLFTTNKQLQIMQDELFVKTHFGKYPVIKVSFFVLRKNHKRN